MAECLCYSVDVGLVFSQFGVVELRRGIGSCVLDLKKLCVHGESTRGVLNIIDSF